MTSMTITDTAVLSDLDQLAQSTGRDAADLVTEILRKHFNPKPRRLVPDPNDPPGSAAELLAAIRADFEEVGWMELELPTRRSLG
ncbi:hypothetical protein FIV34_20850 [Luteibacter pinisoli]|uniref:Uncharacterized protein n=1 Tax=Luteibacter pinisoli TaxID=2589080 RepID=A0A4Y5ZBI5_9GAMM|nr:hypothetical protein [Luteibacter pinisoli]QDE41473.1 hypothetical protein FIV34_20850 [Luteibacter pinisoli]